MTNLNPIQLQNENQQLKLKLDNYERCLQEINETATWMKCQLDVDIKDVQFFADSIIQKIGGVFGDVKKENL